MNGYKGCLVGIIVVVVWFKLWFFCLTYGDTHNISPFTVLFVIIFVVSVIALIVVCIYNVVHEKKYNKYRERVQQIQHKYNLAYMEYVKSKPLKSSFYGPITDFSDLKRISSREDYEWEAEEKKLRDEVKRIEQELKKKKQDQEEADKIKKKYPDGYEKWEEKRHNSNLGCSDDAIIYFEKRIAALDKHVKSEKWENAQFEYADKCGELCKQFLPNYGRYKYNIPFTKYDEDGNEIAGTYTVWQFFTKSMCFEDLDYTYFSTIKENTSLLTEFKNNLKFFKPEVYTKLAQYIMEIANYYYNVSGEKTSVFFSLDKDWDQGVLWCHYFELFRILDSDKNQEYIDLNIIYKPNFDNDGKENNILVNGSHVIIFDIATTNDELEKLCEKIITYGKVHRPAITYISLFKAYDRDEMISLITKENQRQAQKKEKEENAKKNLLECVSSWDKLLFGLPYSYLFYYYPTTCDFEATEEEWENRWIVWNFKNTPGKTLAEEHEDALNRVIPMIKNKLLETFEADSLQYLTLVCIPASSQAKTQARYEEFSERICNELGMINAYPHIKVVSEKKEKRLGGTGINLDNLSFDEDFFKGRYVLLFDDVITKGYSMTTLNIKMKSLGAIVVGGLSLGKTKHERP